jgi:single-stranded-DNA-specific exonuclease
VQLTEDLESWNQERQGTERQVVEEAETRFADLSPVPPILIGWSKNWHPGVLGIAAGRIARTYYRPTILFSVDGDSARGSGRSVSGVHLFDFLGQWREDYARFGGHAQAIGISVSANELEVLAEKWQVEAARQWDPAVLIRKYEYELTVPSKEVDNSLLEELSALEPFGMANRQPVLRVENLCLDGPPRRFGRGHLSGRAVGADGGRVDLLGWGWQAREADLAGTFEILGTLERDRYHGRPVLRLLDARSTESTESAG